MDMRPWGRVQSVIKTSADESLENINNWAI